MTNRKMFFTNIFEVLVLFLIPLPILDLNVLYIILVLVITLSSKYLRKESWGDIGFRKTNLNTMIVAVTIGIVFGFTDTYLLEPLLSRTIGVEPDLSAFESLEGNLNYLIVMLLLGWVVRGLFEEYFFRGYLFHRLRSLIGNPTIYKWITIVLVSVIFGFSHSYQGITGGYSNLLLLNNYGCIIFLF